MTDLKKNVPELRFPEFSGEWEEKKIEDLGRYSKSYSFSRSVEGEGVVHHIHYGDIHSKLPSKMEDINLLPTITENEEFELLQKGDIVFADASEDYKDLGKAILVDVEDGNIIAGLHTHVFRTKPQVVPEFLMYYTKTLTYFKFIRKYGTGISVLGISKKNLSQFVLGLPNYKEQQKIGEFFSKLDHQIELEEQKLALLEEQKKGYMQKIFSQELRFKDENGENYPEWEEQKLDNIANIGTGKSKVKNTGGNYDVLGSTGIIGKSNNYDYEGDFILIARVGHYAGSLYKYSGKVNITDNTIYLKSNIVLEFIYYSLKRYRISRLVFGSGQPLLKSSDIKQLKLFISGEKEQQKIGDFFSKLDRHIELQGKKIELLKQRKQGFLQKMFV